MARHKKKIGRPSGNSLYTARLSPIMLRPETLESLARLAAELSCPVNQAARFLMETETEKSLAALRERFRKG